MVANFGTFKRHHVLFKALRHMSSPVPCRPDRAKNRMAAPAATIRAEARCYGVEIAWKSAATCPMAKSPRRCPGRRSASSCRGGKAHVSSLPSRCSPTHRWGLLDSAEIGSKHFINPQTGRLLHESRLADDLTEFLPSSIAFSRDNGPSKISRVREARAVLNDILKQYALEHGQDWTQDIAPMCWRPDPRLMRSEDRCAWHRRVRIWSFWIRLDKRLS